MGVASKHIKWICIHIIFPGVIRLIPEINVRTWYKVGGLKTFFHKINCHHSRAQKCITTGGSDFKDTISKWISISNFSFS